MSNLCSFFKSFFKGAAGLWIKANLTEAHTNSFHTEWISTVDQLYNVFSEILVPLYNTQCGSAVKYEYKNCERNRPIKVTIKVSFYSRKWQSNAPLQPNINVSISSAAMRFLHHPSKDGGLSTQGPLISSHIRPWLRLWCSTLQLWYVFSLQLPVFPLPKSPLLMPFLHPRSSDLSSHSAVLYLHRSHPACNLPIWSMCCTPAQTCWGCRNGKYLQSSQMGLSAVRAAQSPFSSITAATSAVVPGLQYRLTQMQPLEM